MPKGASGAGPRATAAPIGAACQADGSISTIDAMPAISMAWRAGEPSGAMTRMSICSRRSLTVRANTTCRPALSRYVTPVEVERHTGGAVADGGRELGLDVGRVRQVDIAGDREVHPVAARSHVHAGVVHAELLEWNGGAPRCPPRWCRPTPRLRSSP